MAETKYLDGIKREYRAVVPAETRQKIRRASRKIQLVIPLRLFFAGVLLIVIVASAVGWRLLIYSPPSPISENIRRSVNFPVYYPRDIKIDDGSAKLDGNKLVSYTVHYQGHGIYVSIQPKPSYFDFSTFDKAIQSPVTVSTEFGNGTVGLISGRMVGDLPTEDSWVLLSSDPSTPSSAMVQVMKQLTK